jgi:dTDP-3-amino-3,4,6-trideoxy-alpha-D-glucose transaminase
MSKPAVAGEVGVPFVDLRLSNEAIRADLLDDLSKLIDSSAFVNGPPVSDFERAFAEYCGTADCVGLASGLDALRLALLARGMQPGDEVIVPAHTFVATVEAVTQAGGVPVLADVTEADYGLDQEAAESVVTARTTVLLPVHLYGQMADMRALQSLAERHGLAVLEDACQAHGAERDGLRAGATGLAGAFSFYPAKNLGALGDAGALATDDAELAATVRALREHGQRSKYQHELEGYTARLDTIQALVLSRKLPLLDGWNDERRKAASFLSASLADVGDLVLPEVSPGSNPVWHLYVVRTADPDSLGAYLRARGIASGRHYPEPVHLTRAYEGLGYTEGAFPMAERLAREALSLPIFPGMTDEQLNAVVDGVSAYFRDGL